MAEKESRTSAVIMGALGGATVGGIGSAWIVNQLDDLHPFYSKSSIFNKAGINVICTATVVGVAVGALMGALRPLRDEKLWAQRLEAQGPRAPATTVIR